MCGVAVRINRGNPQGVSSPASREQSGPMRSAYSGISVCILTQTACTSEDGFSPVQLSTEPGTGKALNALDAEKFC